MSNSKTTITNSKTDYTKTFKTTKMFEKPVCTFYQVLSKEISKKKQQLWCTACYRKKPTDRELVSHAQLRSTLKTETIYHI